jgi:tRNA threonylcarbamoyladenosine biosynthesis protein TsaB
MTAEKSNVNEPLILAVETSGRMGSVAIAQGPKLLAEKQFTGPTRLGVGDAEAKELTDVMNTSMVGEKIGTPSRSQMRHSAEIFPAIVNLLKQFGKSPADIEQVYISIGPGSFTGLRIAVTIAKTMALANGAKIVAVDTLDCIAANVINLTADNAESELKSNERLATILDAKRSQFFIAVYEKASDAGWKKILPDCLMTAEEFLDRFANKPTCGERSRTIALVGEGLVYYKDKFNDPAVRVLDEKFWNPSAANVHRLGWQKAQLGDFADPLTLTPNYLRGPDAKVKQV